MSVLGKIESKLASVVEGAFSRAFRSQVRPVEVARKLAREMDNHKTVSIARVYVPNEYAVFLSSGDYENLAPFEEALLNELSGYLLEHARREKLALLRRPQIELHADPRLKLGEFGIQARMVESPPEGGRAPAQGQHGNTVVYESAAPRQSADPHDLVTVRSPTALLLVGERHIVVNGVGTTLGRGRDSDIMLSDPNMSRRHARIYAKQGEWWIEDLESTNGVSVNGRKITQPTRLPTRTQVQLGQMQLTFLVE